MCPLEGLGKRSSDVIPCPSGLSCTNGFCCGVALRVNGSACKAGAECGSGLCVDGFCCDRACDGGARTACEAGTDHTSNDCGGGFFCDPAGTCIAAPSGSDEGGCAVSHPGRTTSFSALALLALGLGARLRRRR